MALILGGRWSERTRAAVACALLAAGVTALFVRAQRGPRPATSGDRAAAARALVDLGAWDAATSAERRAAAVWGAATTPGMAFDRLETFGFEGHRHEMAVFAHEATGLEFSLIPGGTFEMGSPADEADRSDVEVRHRVTLTKPFLICRTECTQAAYERVTGANPSAAQAPDHPVEQVSWNDATAFCGKTGLRLPTEAEWEYACRAGTTTRYWSGDAESDLARVGWYDSNPDPMHPWMRRVLDRLGRPSPQASHHPVALKVANPFGLHDVHGNVWEWCADGDDDYPAAPATDPTGDEFAALRVFRGGGWFTPARSARSANRNGIGPGIRDRDFGFRPARSVAP